MFIHTHKQTEKKKTLRVINLLRASDQHAGPRPSAASLTSLSDITDLQCSEAKDEPRDEKEVKEKGGSLSSLHVFFVFICWGSKLAPAISAFSLMRRISRTQMQVLK